MKALRRWLECRSVRGAIEAHVDGEAPQWGARIEAHLERCPRCRVLADALWAQARALDALLGEEDPPPGFVGRVMERVEAASAPTPTRAPRRARRPAVVVLTAAVAAAITAVVWLAAVRSPAPPGPTVATAPRAAAPAPGATEAVPTPAAPPGAAASTAPAPQPKPTAIARGPVKPRRTVPPAASRTPAEAVGAPSAQQYLATGRTHEEKGQLEEALNAYVAARDEGGSEMARIDVARVYEKSGYTAQALNELVEVAFAEVDDQRWEPLTVQ